MLLAASVMVLLASRAGAQVQEMIPPVLSSGLRDATAAQAPVIEKAGLAALRRAWSADPAIRDFIGLSENSWDFNAPDGVPGFGSPITDDTGRLLAEKPKNSTLSASEQSATGSNKSRR
jgi:hypothetical protein